MSDPTMFGLIARLSIRTIDQGHDRNSELGSELHETQRLPIAFRIGFAIVRSYFLLWCAPSLLSNDENSLRAQFRKAADDRRIIAAPSISVKLQKTRGHMRDIILGGGTSKVPRQTNLLPGREPI